MNIQELSVGDWVRIYVANEERYCKVDEIRWNNILGKYVCEVCDRTFSLSEAYLHPIPLTPEILEKNGWIKMYGSTWELGAYRMRHIANSLFIIYATDNEVDFSLYVTAIHELQRAYKFAGLEKEIEL